VTARRLALALLFLTLTVAVVAVAKPEAKYSVAKQPPIPVETIPASGDVSVDPGLDRIEVTFSKPMMTKEMWSFVQVSGDTFPETTGDPTWKDDRTIVLPVKLKPGWSYVVWVNSEKYDAFRDADGNRAVPYLIAFETRP